MSQGAKILVVDDDPDIVEQLTIILQGEGFSVVSASGVREAEEVLQGISEKPDLAILDLMMEQMDSGLVLANRLKRLYPQTPVILLTAVTAATGVSLVEGLPSSGAADARSWLSGCRVLDKPVRPEQLLNEVNRLLGSAK